MHSNLKSRVFGSLFANHIAMFAIQQVLAWRAKGIIAEILTEIVIQSVLPDPASQMDNEQFNYYYQSRVLS